MKKLSATTVFLALSGGAAADGIIIEQVFDGNGGLASERNTAVSLATTADDFIISDKNTITGILASFQVSTAPLLIDWEYEIYSDAGGMPGEILAASGGGTARDTGGTAFGLAVHSIHFEGISIGLDPGTYWLAIRGVGQNTGERAFWGTANSGNVNGSGAMLKSKFFGFPDWTPWEKLIGQARDVAFTLHGVVPAPGVLVLFGVAGLAGRRRRRVCVS